jgi:hypothetical protein
MFTQATPAQVNPFNSVIVIVEPDPADAPEVKLRIIGLPESLKKGVKGEAWSVA